MENICDYGCKEKANFLLKSGKYCCSSHQGKCKVLRKKVSESKKLNYKLPPINPSFIKIECDFCLKKFSIGNIQKHKTYCYLNPINIKLCPICNQPIKNYKHNITCSPKCARNYFSEMYNEFGRNNGSDLTYRTICFDCYGKKCIVCGEENIVSVHHIDNNHDNNNPINLVPLCPTHHQYIHSKFKNLIEPKIIEWLKGKINA